MQDSFLLIGAGGVGGSALAWLAFWLRFSDRVTTANARAEAAQYAAIESKRLSDEAHTRITALAAEFGMYRERVATDYVSKEAMRELKNDLVSAIEAIGAKLDSVLSYERHDRKRNP